ncbi:MAG TPA: hypothetical protein PLN83_12395 [Syntrophorhabdus sp.]|jgi:hypothetical protein|nr:hypothetical protein [Syntrophorhabdus sp.]
MKTIIFKAGIAFLFILLAVMACEKNKQDSLCYKGKVVSLNNNGNANFNVVEIVKVPDAAELTVGVTIIFNPELYGGELNIGDMVSFKLLYYEKWEGPHYAHCTWPNYVAMIDPCSN